MSRARNLSDLINGISADKITSGTFADARISSSSVTQHASSVTTASGTWTPAASSGSFGIHNARYIRVGNLVHVSCWLTTNGSDPGVNSNKWTITGLPITSLNTGTSNHIVGWGSFHGADDNNDMIMAWVQSNSTTIDFGGGKSAGASMLPNSTSPTNFGQGLSGINGIANNYNVRGPMANNNQWLALGLSYYV